MTSINENAAQVTPFTVENYTKELRVNPKLTVKPMFE